MKIILNGDEKTFAGIRTVSDLLNELGYAERRLAVEVNGEIVPRSEHATATLAPGDAVEIVIAVGGG